MGNQQPFPLKRLFVRFVCVCNISLTYVRNVKFIQRMMDSALNYQSHRHTLSIHISN